MERTTSENAPSSSNSSAKQIKALGEVEKDIARLLQLAASSLSLMTLPRPDSEDENGRLPQGEERSEMFVQEATEYFNKLDAIQLGIRKALSNLRQTRIPPSSINAPPPNFVPPPLGVGPATMLQNEITSASNDEVPKQGLQESRVERDAWIAAVQALQAYKRTQDDSIPSQRGAQ
ncbi:hypothetical protein BOTBODRAFT_56562 [Botryobasidium botryosum FD-172 SS1]|uniref:Mediator of RNA polymerase II transcription subunit 11 n=1 Tax=Botryobasidium botryosum (strain FD-172 SS1) TaxID=930990 RepID=A0A067MAH9_BOTB1|nr:hypothetical protein BOTBODRAFT_56562 [Botryobasidium botryosum FD-172 SS1]